MTSYAAELTNTDADGRGEVARVIVGSPEWAVQNLGGTWVATRDPYVEDDDPTVYAGPGAKHDPGVPEQFVADEWTTEKATQMQPDGEGGFFWFYNTQGQLTWYQGKAWRNLLPSGTPNTNPPPTNWREYPLDNGVPVWVQPTGAFDAYPLDFVVKHEGGRYRSLIPANTTVPGSDDRWWEALDAPPAPEVPAWEPWTSGLNEDLYQVGDRVTHNGQTWEATVGNNYWEPGVFGWVVV